jgi:hypothetical protein
MHETYKLNKIVYYSKFGMLERGLTVQTSNCCPHLSLECDKGG